MRLPTKSPTLRASRRYAAVVATVLLLLPSLAAACATCMNDPNRQKTNSILLGFIGVPFHPTHLWPL